MGYIVAQAGGAVSDGSVDLLSIQPQSISDQVPVYIGGKREIELIQGIPK